MVYRFTLREDMPEGFRKNERYPELPQMVEYLRDYNYNEFGSVKSFKAILDRGPTWDKKDIRGNKIKVGLILEEFLEGEERPQQLIHIVCTKVWDAPPLHPGSCQFGVLRQISKNDNR